MEKYNWSWQQKKPNRNTWMIKCEGYPTFFIEDYNPEYAVRTYAQRVDLPLSATVLCYRVNNKNEVHDELKFSVNREYFMTQLKV